MNGNLSHPMLRTFVNSQINIGIEVIGDHPKGLSLYNEIKKLYFVMIPKNASTSISMAALTSTKDSWVPAIADGTTDSQHIVILRDPVSRFISAANMFLTARKSLVGSLPLVLNNVLNTVDCHFQPQKKFIDSLSAGSIDFFWYNKNVVTEIKQYYGLKFNQFNLNLNIGTRLMTSVDESLIKKLYAKDYELINSVKFVNMP